MKATIKKHPKKTAAFVSIATLATCLQLAGVMGPIVCSLPFITDAQACNGTVAKVKEAAHTLHTLDSLKLDDGTALPFEVTEGGQPVTDAPVAP